MLLLLTGVRFGRGKRRALANGSRVSPLLLLLPPQLLFTYDAAAAPFEGELLLREHLSSLTLCDLTAGSAVRRELYELFAGLLLTVKAIGCLSELNLNCRGQQEHL